MINQAYTSFIGEASYTPTTKKKKTLPFTTDQKTSPPRAEFVCSILFWRWIELTTRVILPRGEIASYSDMNMEYIDTFEMCGPSFGADNKALYKDIKRHDQLKDIRTEIEEKFSCIFHGRRKEQKDSIWWCEKSIWTQCSWEGQEEMAYWRWHIRY